MYIHRSIESVLQRGIAEFPVIALMGPRQVGKSTLLLNVLNGKFNYISFDDMALRAQAKRDPVLFLKNNPPPLIIDEVQYVPEILPAIKIAVDKASRKGLFILTGSQQFNLIRGLRESLAGRVLLLNLPPMTIAEKNGLGSKRPWIIRLFEDKKNIIPDVNVHDSDNRPTERLFRGGLPGVGSISEDFVPSYFSSYIATYLERDLPSQFEIKDPSQLLKFLQLLAPLSSCEINKSQLGRELGISPPTADRWVGWLSASLVWHEHQSFQNNSIKRVSRHPKGFLFDTGLICSLLQIPSASAIETHPFTGSIFETSARIELSAIISNHLVPARIYHWRTPYSHEVDIVIDYNNRLFAFECKWHSDASPDDCRNLIRFRDEYGKAVAFLGVITPAGNFHEITEGIYQIPIDIAGACS